MNRGLYHFPKGTLNTKRDKPISYNNLTANLLLQPDDMGNNIVIGMTATSVVNLPAATLLRKEKLVTITNNYSRYLTVKDANGNIIIGVKPYNQVLIWNLTANDTAGTWATKTITLSQQNLLVIAVNTPTVVQSVNGDYESICALSATTAIAFYKNGTTGGNPTAVVLTVSGTGTGATIAVNTPTVVQSVSGDYESICALSATTAIAFYRNGTTGGNPTAVVLTAG